MKVIEQLVAFVRSTSWARIPEDAQEAARQMFGNGIALAVAAASLPAVECAASALRTMSRSGWIKVPGRTDRWNPLDAAMLTGIAIHLEDFDDTHLPTVLHPAAPIIPAALITAQWCGASTQKVLEAAAVGAEVAIRIGNSTTPGHYNRGWHVTGTMGRIGAAVAAAHILGLNATQMRAAIGIATTEAAGLTAALGTMTKSLHPGRAAADGIEAAMLAAHGLDTGALDPLTDPGSFPVLSAPSIDPYVICKELGKHWELTQNAYKPYACGVVSHPIIDSAIELSHKVSIEEIDRVTVSVNPVVIDVMGVLDPKTGLESKFSAAHCFAIGFIFGAGGPSEFTDKAVSDNLVKHLRNRVDFSLTIEIPKGAAKASITTHDGKTHEVEIRHATGSIQRPMTIEQLKQKATRLVDPIIGGSTFRFIECAFNFDMVSIDDLMNSSIKENLNE